MKENQNIEFKRNWRDEHPRTLCAFANKEQGLTEPEKDIYNEEHLRKMGLNERQIKAVLCVKERGEITISALKKLIPTVSEKTLYRDLKELVGKNLIREIGTKNRTYFGQVERKRSKMGVKLKEHKSKNKKEEEQ